MWVMIGACIISADCAMPSPSTPFETQAACLVAASVRHGEHPGSIYDCVPLKQTDDERAQALHDLWKRNGGTVEFDTAPMKE